MKRRGKDIIVLVPFFLIGALLFSMGLSSIKERFEFFETAIPIEATVIKINSYQGSESQYHRTLVSYTINEQEYQSEVPGKLGNKGEEIEVWYSPEQPDYVASKEDKEAYLLTLGGLGFILIPIIILLG